MILIYYIIPGTKSRFFVLMFELYCSIVVTMYHSLTGHLFNPLMVQPFLLTYLAKPGGGGGVGGWGLLLPSLDFDYCLSDLLLIHYL